jgi:hypothetical protein
VKGILHDDYETRPAGKDVCPSASVGDHLKRLQRLLANADNTARVIEDRLHRRGEGLDIPTRLLALWHEANEEMAKAAGQAGCEDAFNYWSGATKDLLLAVGYEWDDAAGDYVQRTTSARSGASKDDG